MFFVEFFRLFASEQKKTLQSAIRTSYSVYSGISLVSEDAPETKEEML